MSNELSNDICIVYKNVNDEVGDWYNPPSSIGNTIGDAKCNEVCNNDNNCDGYQIKKSNGNCDLIKNLNQDYLNKLKNSSGEWSFVKKCSNHTTRVEKNRKKSKKNHKKIGKHKRIGKKHKKIEKKHKTSKKNTKNREKTHKNNPQKLRFRHCFVPKTAQKFATSLFNHCFVHSLRVEQTESLVCFSPCLRLVHCYVPKLRGRPLFFCSKKTAPSFHSASISLPTFNHCFVQSNRQNP